MSEEKETASDVLGGKKKNTVTLGTDELQTIISTAVSAAVSNALNQSSQGFEKLADAILESRKPYVDPRHAANNESMRKSMRDQAERLKESLKRDQARCQHLQGSHELSDFPSPHGLTSIIHHVFDTGELVGICSNCGKVWRQPTESSTPEEQQDYRQWVMGKKSGNRTSSSGRRFFADPLRAIKAGQN